MFDTFLVTVTQSNLKNAGNDITGSAIGEESRCPHLEHESPPVTRRGDCPSPRHRQRRGGTGAG